MNYFKAKNIFRKADKWDTAIGFILIILIGVLLFGMSYALSSTPEYVQYIS